MAHTPGPWRAVATEIVSTACPDDDCVVADVLSKDYGDNARLIAAAPELLAALKGAKDELIVLYERAYPNSEPINDTTAAIDLAIDAIAKAEGRTDA